MHNWLRVDGRPWLHKYRHTETLRQICIEKRTHTCRRAALANSCISSVHPSIHPSIHPSTHPSIHNHPHRSYTRYLSSIVVCRVTQPLPSSAEGNRISPKRPPRHPLRESKWLPDTFL